MSLFSNLDLVAQATHEAIFADDFVFTPMTRARNVNGGWIADTSRPEAYIRAIYTERDVTMNLSENTDSQQDHRPGVSAHIHSIEVDPRRCGITVALGDLFTSVADNRRWQVEQTDPTDVGRVRCTVRLLGTVS